MAPFVSTALALVCVRLTPLSLARLDILEVIGALDEEDLGRAVRGREQHLGHDRCRMPHAAAVAVAELRALIGDGRAIDLETDRAAEAAA